MEAHALGHNNGLLLARKLVIINVSRSAVQKLALVPACRYKCDAK